MDILTFISSLINSLAWPILIGFLLLLFKKEILGIIKSIYKIKYKQFEIELDREATDIKLGIESKTSAALDNIKINRVIPKDILEMVTLSPKIAVLEMWKKLEVEVYKAVEKKGVTISSASSPEMIVHIMNANGIIDNTANVLYFKGFALRNKIAHESDIDIDADDALRVIDVINELRVFFEIL